MGDFAFLSQAICTGWLALMEGDRVALPPPGCKLSCTRGPVVAWDVCVFRLQHRHFQNFRLNDRHWGIYQGKGKPPAEEDIKAETLYDFQEHESQFVEAATAEEAEMSHRTPAHVPEVAHAKACCQAAPPAVGRSDAQHPCNDPLYRTGHNIFPAVGAREDFTSCRDNRRSCDPGKTNPQVAQCTL